MCARKYVRGLGVTAGLIAFSSIQAQAWNRIPIEEPTRDEMNPIMRWVRTYDTAEVSYDELQRVLKNAPQQIFGLGDQPGVELVLPTSDGRMMRFNVWQNNVLGPQVQKQIPDQRLFTGQGIDEPSATVRFEIGYGNFRAMIDTVGGAYFIEPMKKKNDNTYFIYGRKDSMRSPGWMCRVVDFGVAEPDLPPFLNPPPPPPNSRNTGTNLWTFRLALNACAEYVNFWGSTTAAISGMTTSVNRVDGVYTKEMAIHLNLVWTKVFTTIGVPYTNSNGSAMLTQNQTQMDGAGTPGSANYDIGHVFSTGGGGIAGLGVVGIAGNKAKGVTGNSSPTGDSFDIDYVAHEMGHQFGGNHTFNGTTGSCGGGNRNRTTAWEPGSGSTIMAYAGICGAEDLQPHSDVDFHAGSISEILPYRVASRGGVSSTTTNLVPVANAGADYTIPILTPFKLTMSATDGNGDALTYEWEDMSVPADSTTGGSAGPTTSTTTNTSRPLFRSFMATTNPSRSFPSQSLVLTNVGTNPFEYLPNVARTMTFRAVARDNKATGGGTNWDTAVITASGTTPFSVTAPNSAITWNRNQRFNVTWNNASTNLAPFNVANVNIYLSTNGGASFFTSPVTATLLATTANDGSELISMPLSTSATSTARLFIEGAGNVFFDVSNTNFSVSTTNTLPTIPVISPQTINEESAWTFSAAGSDVDDAQTLSYSLTSFPPGMTINSSTGLISWTPTEAQGPGTYPVTVRVSDNNVGTPGTFDRSFNVTVNEVVKPLTGAVNLNSYIPTEVGQTVFVEIAPNASGATIQSGTVTLGAGNQFSLNAQVPNGLYRVFVSKSQYLRRRISNVNLTASGAVAGTFNLIPGDVDNSGEIDAVDIDLVIANFGAFANPGDIDGSGEVDAVDIDLVIANFGAVGD